MATVYGILAQVAPALGTLTDAYRVPVGKFVRDCRVISANRSGSPVAVRVAVALEGEADALKQYVAYDKEVTANDAVSTVVMTLGERSVVRVRSDTGDVTFTVMGEERTV